MTNILAAQSAEMPAKAETMLQQADRLPDRTMRRWVSDPHEIPGGVWNDIQQLLLARGVAIEKLRNEIIRTPTIHEG
jgi:hypothetical protein